MRKMRTPAVLLGVLLTIPAIGLATSSASGSEPQASTASHASTNRPAMHATKGVVKSVDSTTLVITRSPQKGHEMTFVLEPSTERNGDVAVGSTVEVRYRTEAKQKIAAVISVQGHKHSTPASRQ